MRGLSFFLMLAVLPLSAVEKGQRLPPSGPISQQFAIPCAKLWPYAMRTMVNAGFRPKVSDREGGIATFEWTKGEDRAWAGVQEKYIDQFAVRPKGFLRSWDVFRVDGATLTAQPQDDVCKTELVVRYSGYASGFTRGWYVMVSNGNMERRLLASIGEAVSSGPKAGSEGVAPESKAGSQANASETAKPADAAKPAEVAKPADPAKPAEAAKPATEASKPAEPPKPAQRPPERQSDTQVVRLPG